MVQKTNKENWNMDDVKEAAEISRHYFKESPMNVAYWVLFFALASEHYPVEQLKYQNVPSFLEAYEGRLNDIRSTEQEMLKDEANWFNIVSILLPPTKNKGLSMQVVPHLVEGWHTKYITGSGQTEATKLRVHIFEKEGGVKPEGRGGGLKKTAKKTTKKKTTIKATTKLAHKAIAKAAKKTTKSSSTG